MEPTDELLNAVVAVAPIVILAKFVTHRQRSTLGSTSFARLAHVTCAASGCGALAFGFWGLAQSGHPTAGVTGWALVLLLLALVILVIDGLAQDLRDHG